MTGEALTSRLEWMHCSSTSCFDRVMQKGGTGFIHSEDITGHLLHSREMAVQSIKNTPVSKPKVDLQF